MAASQKRTNMSRTPFSLIVYIQITLPITWRHMLLTSHGEGTHIGDGIPTG